MNGWIISFISFGILLIFFIRYIASKRSMILDQHKRLNLMQALLDHSSSCIYVKDLDLKYVLVNSHALKVFGFKESEVLGKTDAELFPAPYAIYSEASDLKVIQEGRTLKEEHVANLQTGDRDFYTVKTPLKDKHDVIDGICGIALDISQQKRAQKQLNDYLEKLEIITTDLMEARIVSDHVNSAQNAFLASMSHELRTPINGIVGNASILLNTELDVPQEKYLMRIQQSAKALTEIIEQVLDFSKIAAGKISLESKKSDLFELIMECHQILAVKAEEKHIEFKIELPSESIPPIVTDRTRLKEIILNLLGNAIKFTANGTVKLKLSVVALTSKEVLMQIEISDTGIGIAQDHVEHLFERFWQEKPCHTGGTGLGLAISKELVVMMNGEIRAKSTLGIGTTFTLKIPFEIYHEAL